MKTIKIAVAVSSRLRNNNDVSLKSIVNFFNYQDCEIKIETDYYIHLNRKKCIILNGKKNFSQDLISNDEEKMIVDILNPKKFIIEDGYDSIKEKIKNVNLDIRSDDWLINPEFNKDYQRLYPHHSQEESIKLIDEYETKNNFNYDLIFKIRPDLYVEPHPNCSPTFSRNIVFNYLEKYKKMWGNFDDQWAKVIDVDKSIVCLYQEIMNGHIRYADFSFFGTSKSMKLYTYDFIYNYIEYYLYLNKQRDSKNIYVDNYFTPESFLTYPISKYKMNLHNLMFFSYVLIRKNYKNESNFNELVSLFEEHEREEFKKLKNNI